MSVSIHLEGIFVDLFWLGLLCVRRISLDKLLLVWDNHHWINLTEVIVMETVYRELVIKTMADSYELPVEKVALVMSVAEMVLTDCGQEIDLYGYTRSVLSRLFPE